MSYRKIMYIALLLIFLTTTGCSLIRHVDNSSPEDVLKHKISKDDLWNQKKALELEKDACMKQFNDQQAQIVLMNKDISEQHLKIDQANIRITELNRTIDALNLQIKQWEEEREKITKAVPVKSEKVKGSPAKTTRAPKQHARKELSAATSGSETGDIKIKVLAGEGNIASASEMAKRIRKMGYKVKLVDLADRSDFAVTTVYYNADYDATAEEVVKKLGGSAISMPLSWKSFFDLVIVTGRKP